MSISLTIQDLFNRIETIHASCYQVCYDIFGEAFENSGNMGVFCQTEVEFESFEQIKKSLTKNSNNTDQKYFELIEPIKLEFVGQVVIYTHLYIRKPDSSNYGKNLGDIDLRLNKAKYENIYQRVLCKNIDPRVSIYNYNGLEMLQTKNLTTPSLAYLALTGTAEKMRFRF